MTNLMEYCLLLGLLVKGECQSLRLVGGPLNSPNVGRVEMSLNGLWHEVCWRGDNPATDRIWDIQNVIVMCRQMGYPGAGIAGGGRFGDGLLGRSVDNIRCNGGTYWINKDSNICRVEEGNSFRKIGPSSSSAPRGKKCHVITLQEEDSISECLHGNPRNVSCAPGDSAYATCAVPGYLGCFVDQLPRAMPYGTLELPENMSITRCIENCRNTVHPNGIVRYAAVQDARQCFCGMNGTEYDIHGKAPEADCSVLECPGDVNQACGFIWKMAVYDLSKGDCEDTLGIPENGYRNISSNYPGFGSTTLFECKPGFVLIGQSVIQCVLGSQSDEVTWDSEEPICADERIITSTPIPTTQVVKEPVLEKENGNRSNLLLIALLCAIGFVLIIIILVIILCIYFVTRGRKKTRHRQSVKPKTAEDSRVNKGYTDDNVDTASVTVTSVNSNGHQHPPRRTEDTEEPSTRRHDNSVQGSTDNDHEAVEAQQTLGNNYREVPDDSSRRTGAENGGFQFQTVSIRRKQYDNKDSDGESLCLEMASADAAEDDHVADNYDNPDTDEYPCKGDDDDDIVPNGVTTESRNTELSSGYTSDYLERHGGDNDDISPDDENDKRKDGAILVTRT